MSAFIFPVTHSLDLSLSAFLLRIAKMSYIKSKMFLNRQCFCSLQKVQLSLCFGLYVLLARRFGKTPALEGDRPLQPGVKRTLSAWVSTTTTSALLLPCLDHYIRHCRQRSKSCASSAASNHSHLLVQGESQCSSRHQASKRQQ